MGLDESTYKWWEYLMMPLLAGVVGWGTNVLALHMTFYPTRFRGVELWRFSEQCPWGLFGWEGIVPAKAGKVCAMTLDLMLGKLINVKEIFSKIDPAAFGDSIADESRALASSVLHEVLSKEVPGAWEKGLLPHGVRDKMVEGALQRELPTLLRNLAEEMKERIDDVLDVKDMAVKACVQNKALLNAIFQETGKQEFTFIRRSGFYFGALFGLVQMAAWMLLPEAYSPSWLLPIFGFVVGWLTNYVALKLIFCPLEPTPVCCGSMVLHGLFLRRQPEVAETYARVVCSSIVHVPAIWDAILHGPKHRTFEAMVRAHTADCVERVVNVGGFSKPLLVATVLGGNKNRYQHIVDQICDKVTEGLPTVIPTSYDYTAKTLNLEAVIRKKLEGLDSRDFERILHPAFEEDEILLIFTGGVLGALVGLLEYMVFFA